MAKSKGLSPAALRGRQAAGKTRTANLIAARRIASANLRALLRRDGKGPADIINATGLHGTSVRAHIKGTSTPQKAALAAYGRIFGVVPESILSEAGPVAVNDDGNPGAPVPLQHLTTPRGPSPDIKLGLNVANNTADLKFDCTLPIPVAMTIIGMVQDALRAKDTDG